MRKFLALLHKLQSADPVNASLDVDRLGWGKVTVVNVRENMIVRQHAHAILEIRSFEDMQVWIDRSEDFWRMPDANHNLLIICEDEILICQIR